MPTPQPCPAERFGILIQALTTAVWTRNFAGLPFPLINLITDRLRTISQRFRRLATLIHSGHYTRRQPGAPRAKSPGRPRAPNKLPQTFGWLLKLVPNAVWYRSQLETLLRDNETQALLAAGSPAMHRALRSLCWMLHLAPPPTPLPPGTEAPPPRTAKTPKPKAERPAARKRTPRENRVRYVFGLRYPPPFPNPA